MISPPTWAPGACSARTYPEGMIEKKGRVREWESGRKRGQGTSLFTYQGAEKATNQSPVVAPVEAWVRCSKLASVSSTTSEPCTTRDRAACVRAMKYVNEERQEREDKWAQSDQRARAYRGTIFIFIFN